MRKMTRQEHVHLDTATAGAQQKVAQTVRRAQHRRAEVKPPACKQDAGFRPRRRIDGSSGGGVVVNHVYVSRDLVSSGVRRITPTTRLFDKPPFRLRKM
jgi:hypothetical protein